MNARLPQDRYKNTLGTMPIGASGYTVPWAMWPDEDGELWLHGGYNYLDSPRGTVGMKVTRREDGYEVDISANHAKSFRWRAGQGFMGKMDDLPVIKILS